MCEYNLGHWARQPLFPSETVLWWELIYVLWWSKQNQRPSMQKISGRTELQDTVSTPSGLPTQQCEMGVWIFTSSLLIGSQLNGHPADVNVYYHVSVVCSMISKRPITIRNVSRFCCIESPSHTPSGGPHGTSNHKEMEWRWMTRNKLFFDPVWIVPWTTHMMFVNF